MAGFHASGLQAEAWKAERGLLAERLDGIVWLIVANLHVVIENDRRMLENFAAGEGRCSTGKKTSTSSPRRRRSPRTGLRG